MSNRINNKYEYRGGLLDSLQVEHTASDVRNEDEYRKKVLNGLGAEYTDDGINQKSLYRAKVVEGLASLGGGGSSDFSTAKMTIINNKTTTTVGDIQCTNCPVVSVEDEVLYNGFYVEANNQSVFDVVLYKGHAHIDDIQTGAGFNESVDFETEVSVSGNVVLNSDDYDIDITGDCTITIS